MDLNAILVFARVVEAGSFTRAAQALGLPKSTVSRRVSELEERLGARLLQRTTRKLSLTEVGQAFYEHAARVVAEAEEAERVVGGMQDAPRGVLRVTLPLSVGVLAPIVASFMARYPEVEVELVCADRVIDLVEEGFDVALRAGVLADSSLVARSLGVLRSVAVASPAFLRRHGAPKQPQALADLECLLFGVGPTRGRWTLQKGQKTVTVDVRGRFRVNDFDFLESVAQAGLGVALLPTFRGLSLLRAGTLQRVLPGWSSPDVPLHVVYPSTRHLSLKVRAFVDHVREQMRPPPWERPGD